MSDTSSRLSIFTDDTVDVLACYPTIFRPKGNIRVETWVGNSGLAAQQQLPHATLRQYISQLVPTVCTDLICRAIGLLLEELVRRYKAELL